LTSSQTLDSDWEDPEQGSTRAKTVSILEACPGWCLIPWPVHRWGKFKRKIIIAYDDKEIRVV